MSRMRCPGIGTSILIHADENCFLSISVVNRDRCTKAVRIYSCLRERRRNIHIKSSFSRPLFTVYIYACGRWLGWHPEVGNDASRCSRVAWSEPSGTTREWRVNLKARTKLTRGIKPGNFVNDLSRLCAPVMCTYHY